MEIEIDLADVKGFLENADFHRYLLANTPNFETAAFILQAALDAVENATQLVDNDENI